MSGGFVLGGVGPFPGAGELPQHMAHLRPIDIAGAFEPGHKAAFLGIDHLGHAGLEPSLGQRRVIDAGDGALAEIAEQLGREIEASVSDEALALMVKQKGFAEVAS